MNYYQLKKAFPPDFFTQVKSERTRSKNAKLPPITQENPFFHSKIPQKLSSKHSIPSRERSENVSGTANRRSKVKLSPLSHRNVQFSKFLAPHTPIAFNPVLSPNQLYKVHSQNMQVTFNRVIESVIIN